MHAISQSPNSHQSSAIHLGDIEQGHMNRIDTLAAADEPAPRGFFLGCCGAMSGAIGGTLLGALALGGTDAVLAGVFGPIQVALGDAILNTNSQPDLGNAIVSGVVGSVVLAGSIGAAVGCLIGTFGGGAAGAQA